MKKLAKILTIVFILSLFGLTAHAESSADEYISDFKDILPEGSDELVEEPEKLIEAVGLRTLLTEIFTTAAGARGEVVSFFLLLLGSVALISSASFVSDKISEVAQIGVGMICSVIIFERAGSVFSGVGESLSQLSNFFASLVPLMAAITVSGGGNATASVQHMGMNITLSLVGWVGSSFFYTVASVGFAVGLFSALGDNGASSVSRGIKSFFSWMLGIATTLIMGTLTLQSAIASASDSAAMRAAKYAASGMIPVVGGTVSGALSTLASGLSYAKGVVGVGAISVMVGIILSPLIVLLLYRLALSLSAVVSDFLGVSGASRIFGAFRAAFDSLIAVYALCGVLYIFEIVLFMKSGVALL